MSKKNNRNENLENEIGIYKKILHVWFDIPEGNISKTIHKSLKLKPTNDLVESDFQLFVISPKNNYMLDIFRVVDNSNKRCKRTVAVFLEKDGNFSFKDDDNKTLKEIKEKVTNNGCHVFNSVKDAIKFLNEFYME